MKLLDPMAANDDSLKAMQLRKKLCERTEELQRRAATSSSEAFERVFHERMDTYFAQQERLDELEELLCQFSVEIGQAHELEGLKRLASRLDFLEDHFEEIDSQLYNRPARRRRRFNLFDFFRPSDGGPSTGVQTEFSSEAEAFQELGLAPGAGLKSVTATFRRLIKELHPDQRGGDRSAEPKLRRLVAAYEYIKKRLTTRPSSSG